MKHDWEYKKLGEVCNIYQPKTISSDMLVEDGQYYVYGANGIIGRYDKYNHEQSELLMTCRGATCGSINISKPFSWINGNAMVIHPLTNTLSLSYLRYYLAGIDLTLVISGAAQPQITRQSLSPVIIAIPPILVQQQIVSELDKLNLIIEKKKQQVKELDNLAQSIFYDMFGDPVENEKGWTLRKWDDVFDTKTGKLNANAMVEGGKYPFFTCSKESFFIDNYAFDCEALLLAGNNANAKYDVKYYKGKFNAYQRTYVLTLKEGYHQFFKVALEGKLSLLQEQSIGGMTKYLTLGILGKLSFIVPPLPLQQSFAAKVEAIERQKDLINQSIREAQTLFDSRMEYYFGES